MNRLIIIGAGGHGEVVADIALKSGYDDICFVDDYTEGLCLDFRIIGTTKNLDELNDNHTDFVIAVGNNSIRRLISERNDVKWVNLIHPSAQIGYGVEIGVGTVVMAGAVINSGAKIGKHCIVNSCAIIEHDNILKDFTHISPNAVLGGSVTVGEEAHIGIGASVINNISLGNKVVIGAGAVVTRNFSNEGTYIGIPAKKYIKPGDEE